MSLFSGIRKKLESFGNRAIAQIDRNDGGRTAFNYNQQRFTQPQRPQPRPVQRPQFQAPPQQSIYSRVGNAAYNNSFTRPLAQQASNLARSTFTNEQLNQYDKNPLEGLKAVTAEVLSPTNIARANPVMATAQLNTAAQKAVGIKGPNAQKIVNTGIDKFNQSRFGSGGGIYKATSFAGNNFVAPIVKSGARFSDVSSGRDRYDKGIKGFSQYGTDAFNVGSAIYTPIKAGVIAKGGMPALKAVPGALARGAGAGVGINVVDQLNRGTKIKDLNAKEALLTGAIGAGANLLPGAAGFVGRSAKAVAPKIGKATAKTVKTLDNKLMENPRTRGIEDTINTKKLLYDNASPSQRNILNREIAQLRQEANAIKNGGYASVPIGKDVSKGLSNEQADFINNYANMIEDMGSGNGVDINPATGTRVSNNVRLGDTKGKNMTKADWFDEARRQIESGEAMYDAGTDYKALPGLAKEAPQVSKTPTVKSKPSITAIASEKPSVVAKAPLVEGQNAVRLGSGFDSELVPAKFPTDINVRNGVGTQIKTALVEKDNPLIKTLSQVEKKTGKKGIVDQFLYDSGLASRSDSIANVKLNNNANLKSALSGLSKKELKTFNDYAAARSELYNASRGLKTSRPVGELQAVVDTLGGQHAKRFDDLNKFYKDYAKDLYDGGVIDKAKYDQFIASPDYIRTQRDMADVVGARGSGGRGYSLKTTLTSKKRVGSSRELLPADRTAFDYAQKAQGEIQQNQVASNLIDSLEGTSLIRKADQGELLTNKNTIGRFKNGVREIYIVDPEIKQVIDNVAPFQLNTLEKIVAAPKRIFQAGTTGLSAPFTLANYVKDQLTSGINSKSIIDTHNPANIVVGLWEATKEFAGAKNSDSWERFAAHAGDTTQYDLLRGAKNANQLSRELRNGFGGKVVNRITSPIKTLEDLVSITEKATRYQNFRGMEGKLLKQTGNRADALREASLAAWQNSVDFNRYGDWGKTLNLLIPYFNSGIQGSRQLVRSFKNRPLATSVKTLGTVGLPLIGMTAWNMQTPERKAVYDNISDFEKENNFIVIPPGPLGQNQDGTYNVWKVPMPQGYSNLITPMRRAMESFANKSPQDWANISQDLMGAVSGPINTNSAQQAIAGLIPQAAKPLVQQAANKDFFTNKAIVPDYVNEATDASGQPIPENKKAFNYTSGSAQMLGDAINQSPIRIEKFFKDTFGKTGQYGTNALDNALAKLGVIKPSQIGGISVKDDISRRFTKAQGEYNNNKSAGGKYYDSVKQATANLNTNERSAYNALHPSKTNFTGEEIFDENKRLTKYARAGLYLQFPKVFAADKALNDAQARQGSPSNPLYDLPKDQLTRVLLKATLPPGSKDPELSNLYDKEWYQDYNAKRSKYYNDMKAKLAKEGKKMPKSDNPYPDTPANLQKTMDTYSALPKGTGARSSWIKANGPSFELMKQQWANIDAWENKERVALGLSPIANEQSSSYASGSGYGGGYGGGGGGGQSDNNPNKYAISRTAGGSIKLKSTIKKPKVVARIASPPVNTGKGKGKLVKSKV